MGSEMCIRDRSPGCHRFDQKTNEFILRISALASKKRSNQKNKDTLYPSIRNRVLCSGMLLYLHHRNSKLFFHPAKFDNFKDEKKTE